MKDLTQGHPGKVLLRYTLPLFGSIIFQQLYNIADSLVAGRWIGTGALAAVGNSYEITLIYIALATGLNIGCSVITAGIFGQKNYGDVKTCVHTSLIFGGIFSLVMLISGLFLSGTLLSLIRTAPDIFEDSRLYLNIYLLGYPALLIYNICNGLFSAMGDSKTPFYFLAVSSVANIFVDILFVAGFHMGIAGVAWATFLCQTLSGLAALWTVLRKVHGLEGKGKLFSSRILKNILHVAIPSALQQSFISIGNIVIQGVINGFGVAATAGYAAAIKLNNMAITSLTAMGNGISNYSAQNLGAQRHDRVREGTRWGCLISLGLALGFTALFQLLARQLMGLFITDPTDGALPIGIAFLRIVTPFYCVICLKLSLDGVLRGAQQMTYFMIATFTDLILRVVLTFMLSVPLGTNGIWLSWPIGWAVGTAVSALLWRAWFRRIEK